MKLSYHSLIIAITCMTSTYTSFVHAAEPTGLEIMQQIEQRNDGDDLIQRMDQKLIDKRGGTRERHMVSFRKDYGADNKSISYFLEPSNVRDTALLTYDYDGSVKEDDQWLYLPALKKVRRIAAADRGDYFMGTDFTFEDIKQTPELDDYTWTLLRSETVQGQDCWVIQAEPKTEDLKKNLGYSKTITHVRKDVLIPVHIDYWDIKAQLLKQLNVDGITQIDGIWTATHMLMKNIQSNHSTEIVFSAHQYNTGLSDRTFSERMLKRGYRE